MDAAAAVPSLAQEAVTSPSVEEEEASLSPSLSLSPSAAPSPSPGSVLSLPSSELVQESGSPATPVTARGSTGSDSVSTLEGVVDETTDSKGAVSPVQEDEEVAAAAAPGAVSQGEVPGVAVVSPVVVDDGNPRFSGEGQTLAVAGENAAAVDSSQNISLEEEEEDFGNRSFVGGGEEEEEEVEEKDSSMVKNDGISEENNPVPEDAVVEVGNFQVEKVEEVEGKESPAAEAENTAISADTDDVYVEALPEPLEAHSSGHDSAKIESNTNADGNVGGEIESETIEAESTAVMTEYAILEIDNAEAPENVRFNNDSIKKIESADDAIYKEALSKPLPSSSDVTKDGRIESEDSINATENIDQEGESKATESLSNANAEAEESGTTEASGEVDLDVSSMKNVEAADAGESPAPEVDNAAGVDPEANDVAIHEEAADAGESPAPEVDNAAAVDPEANEVVIHEEELSKPLEAEPNALEESLSEEALKSMISQSGNGINTSGSIDKEETYNGREDINSINASKTDPERGIAEDLENEEIIEAGSSKSPELAFAENSEDLLGDKVGNLDASLTIEGIEKGSMESDCSINLDDVCETKSSDKLTSFEENTESEKLATESRNFGLDAEDNESKAEYKDPESPDMKENGTVPTVSDNELKPDAANGSQVKDDVRNDDENMAHLEVEEREEEKGLVSEVALAESTEVVKHIIREMAESSSDTNANSDYISSRDYADAVEGQIVTDSDEEVETDEEGEGKELFDSAALAALLKAATGSSTDGSITLSSQEGSRIFTMERPAGLGSSVSSLKPAPARSTRPPLFTRSELAPAREDDSDMNEEDRKLHEQVDQIRVKFLRLVHRLKHSPEGTVAAQVLYRLGLAEGIRRGRQTSRTFDLENAKRKALELEAGGEDDLSFSCNILVIGKSGVGKSATINSIFGEERAQINAFEAATMSVKEISGIVDGVKVRIIDTPGLRASAMEQSSNRKILSAIKKYTKKCPPDIVLYVDRLDTQTRDVNDLPLLRSITSTLGSSIWFNAIVALTHAASAPPDGPNGSPLSYEVLLAQRSHVVQHLIRQAAGDMRLMNPVALVENHPSCRRNKEGEKVLPNGLSWRPQMLLLCYSSKILSEANSLLKLQEPSSGKLFGFRLRSPPLPVLLSSLLQSRVHPKLAADQGGDNGDSDLDMDDFSDADEEDDEDEYDQLPPFKPLRKAQIAKLTKEQRKAYFEEYDYRVKLLQKKQLKEEIRRMKEMKKKGKSSQDDFSYGDMAEDDQYGAPATVPVPLPDMVLPPSFDCENPVYRYRFLEPTSQLLTRPVLDTHSWDHDCGYDGVSIEHSLALSGCFPAGVTVQITKDKKDFNIHLDSSVAMKHGQNASTLACFEVQPVGRQLAYTLRGETKFKNLKKNKTTGGISVTFLGESVATGLKLEDQLSIGKRLALVASTGAVRAQGDMAYGANLEARLRDKDFPIGQALTTLGLSLMKWRGDLALGANMQSQFSVGRNSKMAVRVGLNNKLSGQISVKTSTSEQLQIALVGILPIAASLFRTILSGESYSAH